MKTRIFILATLIAITSLVACNGSGSASSTDSVKTDTSSLSAPADSMHSSTDSSMKKDTTSMPK